MFRRRRERKALKEAAKKARKEEEAAARNIQLIRVAPSGAQYGEEFDYPLSLGNTKRRSRSMDVLNGDPRPPANLPSPTVVVPNEKKKKKKSKLRRAQSLAEDGMLAQSQQDLCMHEPPVYYYNDAFTPVYMINERGNGDIHPSMRPRYLVASSVPHQRSLDPAYLTSGAPVLYQPSSLAFNQRQYQVDASPTTPTSTGRSPSPARAAHSRNVQIIPKLEHPSKNAQKRPVSQFYATSGHMRPTSTPLRSPSPMRSPSPAIFCTTPRNKKGKAIKVVEGWNEPDDETPKYIQSHEVGVAPTSKVMDDFKNRNTSSPFSITISNNKYNSSVVPSSPHSSLQLREQSRRNKARPVSAAPWAEYHQKTESVQRQNGHTLVDFSD